MEKVKVKVTQKQAVAIEHAIWLYHTYPDIVERYVNRKIGKDILDIPLGLLMGALYIGYVVEPEFKVGDWVIWDHESEKLRLIGQLVLEENELRVNDSKYGVPQYVALSKLRHATLEEIQQEKERRWWAKHGREVWELKYGDILYYQFDKVISIVKEIKDGRVHFLDDESEPVGELKGYYNVVCFVENRVDIGDSNES